MYSLRRAAAAAIVLVAPLLIPACAHRPAGSEPASQRMVGIGYDTEIPLANATTNAKTLPATALFASGPYDLSAKLRAYGMGNLGPDTPVWIDGTRHFGIEALAGLTLDDIVRVDVVRGVWSGITGNPLAPRDVISITTKRAQPRPSK